MCGRPRDIPQGFIKGSNSDRRQLDTGALSLNIQSSESIWLAMDYNVIFMLFCRRVGGAKASGRGAGGAAEELPGATDSEGIHGSGTADHS